MLSIMRIIGVYVAFIPVVFAANSRILPLDANAQNINRSFQSIYQNCVFNSCHLKSEISNNRHCQAICKKRAEVAVQAQKKQHA